MTKYEERKIKTCQYCQELLFFAQVIRCECTGDGGRFEEKQPGYYCSKCKKYFTADTIQETEGYSHWWSH